MSGVIFLVLRFLLAAALYVFLGWALLTLWRDIKRSGEILTTREVPSIRLGVKDGDAVRTLHFSGSDICIGRDPTCDCTLSTEKVSANHATLTFHHNQWWVEDLDSTNGSYLNDELLTVPVVIANGDHLRCGDVELTISFQT